LVERLISVSCLSAARADARSPVLFQIFTFAIGVASLERGHKDTNCDMLRLVGHFVHTPIAPKPPKNALKYGKLPPV
jgi:hypothetical protein